MKITLLDYTGEPERSIASAARLCYSKRTAKNLRKDLTSEEVKRLIRMVRRLGHLSVFEHASFSFGIDGISRVTSHQLIRHRLASYSQQSQRYVDLSGHSEFIMPDSIKDSDFYEEAKEILKKSTKFYEKATNRGIPPEDARYLFPQGITTNIVVTMNARELLHFFTLRCCRRAQWEIRKMACLMLKEVLDIAPVVFEKAGPACFSRGKCKEGKMTCGKPLKSIEELYRELNINI